MLQHAQHHTRTVGKGDHSANSNRPQAPAVVSQPSQPRPGTASAASYAACPSCTHWKSSCSASPRSVPGHVARLAACPTQRTPHVQRRWPPPAWGSSERSWACRQPRAAAGEAAVGRWQGGRCCPALGMACGRRAQRRSQGCDRGGRWRRSMVRTWKLPACLLCLTLTHQTAPPVTLTPLQFLPLQRLWPLPCAAGRTRPVRAGCAAGLGYTPPGGSPATTCCSAPADYPHRRAPMERVRPARETRQAAQ